MVKDTATTTITEKARTTSHQGRSVATERGETVVRRLAETAADLDTGNYRVIEGRIIVCLASAWDYDPTSKHQIMKILAGRNDIVWINYHGTRRPAITGADLKTGFSVLRRVLKGIRRVDSSIIQVTPLVVPGAKHRLLRKLHERMLVSQIRRAIATVPGANEKPIQVWSFAPDVPFLVGKFNEECFLYYCVDEHSQFKGVDPESIVKAEAELMDRADVVITTSEALFQSKRTRRPDTVLVRHGVNFERFSTAWRDPPPRPDDLPVRSTAPIFGFFGLIDFWIDCELIAEVARLRPNYTFVLIGDCKVDVSRLRKRPNVHFLGRKPNEDLPAYCAAFDAGLLPFVNGPMTRNVNPIKMYEYLAAGLPIVSTPMPEAERFTGPIRIADSPDGFARACDGVLATDSPDRRRRISGVVEGESWLSKVELLSDIVANRRSGLLRTASRPTDEIAPPMSVTARRPHASPARRTFDLDTIGGSGRGA